ncbi:MAG TPA: TolC family protein [Kofleriaceae bacterium]|nr:TolC family protein [Kofleriaceae bacterium]
MANALRDLEREHAAAVSGELALGGDTLDRGALVAAVLARNPEVEVARETWRAASAAYPSAVSLADPMVTYEVAPFSVTGDVPFGQRVQVSQKLPFPGKRELAGEAALAEADAARADFGLVRQQLAEMAVGAFDDYYVAARALEVNAHHRELIDRVQRSAAAQYTVGRAASQDPLEAEGELIMLDRERLMLTVQQHAAIAKINRLLRRSPDTPLPPPPRTLAVAAPASTAGPGDRPLDPRVAAQAKVRARTAEVAVSERAFYPDFEVMAGYDSMFDDWHHQYTVGIAIEIPLQRAGRHGAVEQARAGLAGATAELDAVSDTLAEERSHAQREVDEAGAALALFEQRAVPNAKARVDAAIAGFTSGQVAFPTVMMAERALRDAELSVERARADLDRKTATLDRLNGRIAGGAR